jgi:glycerophosphoryl diester phosphodiesterase
MALHRRGWRRRSGAPGWVAHAGLGIGRPGGAPDSSTLATASRLGPDRVELDVCTTADGRLVLRHDVFTAEGVPVGRLHSATLRHLEPWLLSVDQGVEMLGGLPVMLDVKSDATATVLARWLRGRRDLHRFVVCTESRGALLALRRDAPRVERWRSFPDMGPRRRDHVARVLTALFDHRRPRQLAFVAGDLAVAARDLYGRRDDATARAASVPWRRLLPLRLGALSREVSAAGVCVHHWLLTAHLVEAAASLRPPMVTWTVNDAASLRRVAACGGVDMVTTDDVPAMRIAWGSMAARA